MRREWHGCVFFGAYPCVSSTALHVADMSDGPSYPQRQRGGRMAPRIRNGIPRRCRMTPRILNTVVGCSPIRNAARLVAGYPECHFLGPGQKYMRVG